jgi:hypothetical protein
MLLGEAVRSGVRLSSPTDPLVPLLVAAAAGVDVVVWVLAGLVAGHSLSGSA